MEQKTTKSLRFLITLPLGVDVDDDAEAEDAWVQVQEVRSCAGNWMAG